MSTLTPPPANASAAAVEGKQQSDNNASGANDIDKLTRYWRQHPKLNLQLKFPCWKVPLQPNNGTSSSLQTIVASDLTQPYLASRMNLWKHVKHHRRVKVVQDMVGDKEHKWVVLHPNTPTSLDEFPNEVQQLLTECGVETRKEGQPYSITHTLHASDFTASFLLHTLLPKTVHPPPTSFETVGHVAHLNLRDHHVPYRHLIGQVLLETLPSLKVIIHKVGEVQGPYRTYPYEVVAAREGEQKDPALSNTVVSLTEWGVNVQLDVRHVYWSSRLGQERKRLVQTEFQRGQWIADAFCGVGALCLQAAKHKQCHIVANDWNPDAINALQVNVESNKLQNYFSRVTCGDAYEFLTGLGCDDRGNPMPSRLPHHVVLNYPLQATSFLGALRWWPAASKQTKNSEGVVPRVHVYMFAREPTEDNQEDATSRPMSAEEQAVEDVASHLLPMMPGEQDDNHNSRWQELDSFFGCSVRVHNVRDVAPGKVVVCVSFSATPRLLRYMQGNYD